ncbi:CocE/NonD family hydrolase [Saccharothrix isguenensis]
MSTPISLRRERSVRVERDLPVVMADGTRLLADRYVPTAGSYWPTVLIRSPMGRRPLGSFYGRFFARNGFQVVVQGAREPGEFLPLHRERQDGLDTVAWLREQPWFDGSLVLHGMSALGFCHWAVAADIPELKAMSVQVSASSIASTIFFGGSTALESLLIWVSNNSFRTAVMAPWRARRAIRSGRPLTELDTLTNGVAVPFYQAVIADTGPGSPLRTALDHSSVAHRAELPPTHLVGGWYDIFLPGQIRDYEAMRANGHEPHLTVGPWAHYDPRQLVTANREALYWFRAHLFSGHAVRDLPVRLFVTGAREWRNYPHWPPPGTSARWHLTGDHTLGREDPADSAPDCFTYSPKDPTPAPRGPVIVGDSRPHDNRRIERRPDVLTYTSAPLTEPMDVIGTVTADLFVRASRDDTDFVVRLCDVRPDGRSINVCEGLRRLGPGEDPEGVRRILVELWPAAHRFARGHRLRVQVCGAAVPRFAPGTEPAEQELFHDPLRPSAMVLPVADAHGSPTL